MKPVRYSYGITAALLAGGATLSLMTGFPAGAQVAQNELINVENAVPVAGAPASFADLTEVLMPAVVNISTTQRITVENANPFQGTPFADMFSNRRGGPTTREGQSLGSGFIVSADGFVVTNNHVVQPDARATLESITVTLANGTEYDAELIGSDPDSDLAVLKITRPDAFPFVRFGESSEARVGDWVIAIGNPFGLDGTVTSGIVSAVQRSTGRGAFERFIQTDASINRGNSGGPLFDMRGNVIGINNAILSPSGGSVGIGLAIPSETAAPIVESLIGGVEIERGYLGVRIQPVTEDFADALGIPENSGEFIQSIQEGEAAEAAGLQAGDVVTSVNGEAITQDQSLSYIVSNLQPGTTVPVEFIRDGETRRVNVTVGKRPSREELEAAMQFSTDDDDAEPIAPKKTSDIVAEALGLQVMEITSEIARQLRHDMDDGGVVISAVDPNSDAAQKGIGRGVIILSANYTAISSIEDLEEQIAEVQAEGREAILLRVQPQRGAPAIVPVRLNEE